MNSVSATISKVQTEGSLSMVSLQTASGILSCIVIDTPDSCSYLQTGHVIEAIFKETEVAIAKEPIGEISLRNRIKGTIQQIEQGKLLTRVSLDTASGIINSVISSKSATEMQLAEGMEAFALVKTNEIMLAP